MTIHRGENKRILVEMLQADGVTGLLYSSLTDLKVDLIQDGSAIKTLTRTSTGTPLRAGTTSTSFLLELTEQLSASLVAGVLTIRCFLTIADALNTSNGGTQTSIVLLTDVTVIDP